jgi:hypothetical protein
MYVGPAQPGSDCKTVQPTASARCRIGEMSVHFETVRVMAPLLILQPPGTWPLQQETCKPSTGSTATFTSGAPSLSASRRGPALWTPVPCSSSRSSCGSPRGSSSDTRRQATFDSCVFHVSSFAVSLDELTVNLTRRALLAEPSRIATQENYCGQQEVRIPAERLDPEP